MDDRDRRPSCRSAHRWRLAVGDGIRHPVRQPCACDRSRLGHLPHDRRAGSTRRGAGFTGGDRCSLTATGGRGPLGRIGPAGDRHCHFHTGLEPRVAHGPGVAVRSLSFGPRAFPNAAGRCSQGNARRVVPDIGAARKGGYGRKRVAEARFYVRRHRRCHFSPRAPCQAQESADRLGHDGANPSFGGPGREAGSAGNHTPPRGSSGDQGRARWRGQLRRGAAATLARPNKMVCDLRAQQ